MSIVITGNPGVGKHAITREIANKMNLAVIDISEVAKDSGLLEKGDETNDVDTNKLESILEDKISDKSIVVGHLATYVLKKSQVRVVVVLRRSPYDLIKVYQDRRYSERKSKENAGSEILGIVVSDAICKFQEKIFQINVSGRSISETVECVSKIITDNIGNEEVDWLELVEKNDDLGRFFAD